MGSRDLEWPRRRCLVVQIMHTYSTMACHLLILYSKCIHGLFRHFDHRTDHVGMSEYCHQMIAFSDCQWSTWTISIPTKVIDFLNFNVIVHRYVAHVFVVLCVVWQGNVSSHLLELLIGNWINILTEDIVIFSVGAEWISCLGGCASESILVSLEWSML